jgi:hypothetical protein
MKTFKIKPAVDKQQVLDPVTRQPLKVKGEEKPRNEYWLRRVLDKSVIEIKTIVKEQK